MKIVNGYYEGENWTERAILALDDLDLRRDARRMEEIANYLAWRENARKPVASDSIYRAQYDAACGY